LVVASCLDVFLYVCRYRFNGLTWSHKNISYVNERVVGTQFTAWHYVASVRASLPAPMRALVWWGSDDHTWSPKVPLYGGATTVDETYDDGNCSARLECRRELGLPGSMMNFSWSSAFWVNSAVANTLYGMHDRAAPVVRQWRQDFDAWAVGKVDQAEPVARRLLATGEEAAGLEVLTQLAIETSKEATARWTELWQHLMVSFADGMTATVDETNKICGCKKAGTVFEDAWGAKVVVDTGDHFRLPSADCDYIDADGKCHKGKPPMGAAMSAAVAAGAIPKERVSGVTGCSL
jgi:dipeptidase